MYVVINKNNKQQEEELFPAFIIDPLISKAKLDKKLFVKPQGKYIEVQGKNLWLLIKQAEFTSS